MRADRVSGVSLAALVAVVAALLLPLGYDGAPLYLVDLGPYGLLIGLLVGAAAVLSVEPPSPGPAKLTLLVVVSLGVIYALAILPTVEGRTSEGYWALVIALWLLAWRLVAGLSANDPVNKLDAAFLTVFVPLIFGATLILLWEFLVRGFAIPFVIMPPPSAIWAKLIANLPILWADFRQTFLKSVLIGYAIGCGSGFVVAVLVDRIPFMRRGLLPVGNLVSALPIIGIAPIMVMWFGFDWPSKAAVVVAMTFFPMLVNTLTGLAVADAMQRDLMRTYAASYWQSFFKLRLPEALPFVFNALKINSTLAIIGAIVAEFFGTPIVGMGFRISTEIGRMNTDMVWAEIAVAAVAGSAFYGVVALIERAVTFWHPSFRR